MQKVEGIDAIYRGKVKDLEAKIRADDCYAAIFGEK